MNLAQIKSELVQKPSKRELVIFGIVLLVFLIVFVRSCYSPSQKAISDAKQSIIELKGEVKSASQPVAGEVPAPVWNGTEEQRKLYESFARTVGSDPDAMLIRAFSNPNMQQGLKIVNIELPIDQAATSAAKQKFKISVSGPFDGVGEYVQRLAGLPMLLIMEKITMTLADEESGKVNADIEGSVYGWN